MALSSCPEKILAIGHYIVSYRDNDTDAADLRWVTANF